MGVRVDTWQWHGPVLLALIRIGVLQRQPTINKVLSKLMIRFDIFSVTQDVVVARKWGTSDSYPQANRCRYAVGMSLA